MKLPAFDYAAPQTLAEAIELLVANEDALPLSGGQSLIPILAFRLAAPSLLVDLRRIPGLDTITLSERGIRLGAKVRWCDIEADHASPPHIHCSPMRSLISRIIRSAAAARSAAASRMPTPRPNCRASR